LIWDALVRHRQQILTADDVSHRGGYGTIDTVAATVHYYADFPVACPQGKTDWTTDGNQ